MPKSVRLSGPAFDDVTEVTMVVPGVLLKVTPVQHFGDDTTEFMLTVSDLDSGDVFKTLKSKNLATLLNRQHQLVLAFAD